MGEFSGMLNSKSVYGQSYGDAECFRIHKLNKVYSLFQVNNVIFWSWHKKGKKIFPSWGKNLWNHNGEITYTQRQENKGRKVKKVVLFRWRNK